MYQHFGKRLLDLAIALPALLALSPVFAILAILVRLRLGSPVLFAQQRPGLHGQPFVMWKFRTMTDARDEHGNLLPDKERMTRLGNFLRKTSLDELPELLNVFKGDMSLIGPRPLAMIYLTYYTVEEMRRHDVKPGITGWAQVNGRNSLTWEEKFAYDLDYVNRQSFFLDVKILARTVGYILKRSDIGERGVGAVIDFHEYRKKQRETNQPSTQPELSTEHPPPV